MKNNYRIINDMLISVLACNRPKHLFVTLDSIFKMRNIEKYPVSVMVLYNSMDNLQQQLHYISQFPIAEIKILYEKPNCHENHLSQFIYLNNLNYHWYLLIEDDIILRPDSLEYLEGIEKHAFVNCLYSNEIYAEETNYIYRPMTGNVFANLYNKYTLGTYTQWLCSEMVMGLNVPGINNLFYKEPNYIHFANDCRLSLFCEFFKIVESVPIKSKCLHFGLNTSIDNDIRAPLEAEMFAGEKDQWLENILGVLDRNREKPEITKILRPSRFEYR